MSNQTFSDKLRQTIESSGVSRYALARSVGISDTALSRFMSGERGLTMATIDKLADVLGLHFRVGVQKTPRTMPRGRRVATKKGKKGADADRTHAALQEKAVSLAKEAHDRHAVWRGVWQVPEVGAVCIYNNHPYEDDGQRDLREDELNEFRSRMKAKGIKELAYATYPPEGQKNAGYTYAMLIDAEPAAATWVIKEMTDIVFRTNWEPSQRSDIPRQQSSVKRRKRD